MSNASGPEVSTIETLQALQRTSPIATALRQVSELKSFLPDLEVATDEEQLQDEARGLVAAADALWPWLDKGVLVSGQGYVTETGEETDTAFLRPVVMEDVHAISAGFVLLSDSDKPLGQQYEIAHLLRVRASELRTTPSAEVVENAEPYDVLEGEEDDDETSSIDPDLWVTVKSELDSIILEPIDLEGPADQALLEYFYPELMGEIDVAALNEASLTKRLRRLAKLDLSVVNTMPPDHTRELMRYLSSLELFKDKYPYKIGHAVLVSVQSEEGSGDIDDGQDGEDVTLLAQVGGFTLAQFVERSPDSDEDRTGTLLALNASGLMEDGTPFEAVLPLTPSITARSLWPPRSRKSAR